MSEKTRKEQINQTGRAWVVAIVAIIAAVLMSVNNQKLGATSSLVLPALGIDTSNMSFLMSVNGYVGFVLAFFAATIILKFGTKNTTFMVLICALVGATISAFATSYDVLLVGRLIEGIGYSCIGTVIPVLFSEWFPPSKRGLPMGVFSVWVPLGGLFIMGTSGFFFDVGNPDSYHNVFWFVAAMLGVVAVAWLIAVKNPQVSYLDTEGGADEEKPKVSEGFKSLSCWLGFLAFAAFSLGTACVMNFETLYMIQTMGMDQGAANAQLNILNLSVIVGGVAIGFVMNAIVDSSKRLVILCVAAAIEGVALVFAYIITPEFLVVWMIVFGLANGVVPAIFFTMVAEIAPRPQLAPVASTLMSLGQCVGGILFGVIGAIVASAWSAGTGMLAVTGAVLFLSSIALTLVIKARHKGAQM